MRRNVRSYDSGWSPAAPKKPRYAICRTLMGSLKAQKSSMRRSSAFTWGAMASISLMGGPFGMPEWRCDISKVCDKLRKSGQTGVLRALIIESVCEASSALTRNEGVSYVRSPQR